MRRSQIELRLSFVLAVAAVATSLGCNGGDAGPSSCATTATPDFTAQGDFDVDTGCRRRRWEPATDSPSAQPSTLSR